MNTLLASPRLIRLPNDELISIAVDEGYDSLAYALACRLEQNLEPDESDELKDLRGEVKALSYEYDNLEDQIRDLEYEKEELEQELAKYKEVK